MEMERIEKTGVNNCVGRRRIIVVKKKKQQELTEIGKFDEYIQKSGLEPKTYQREGVEFCLRRESAAAAGETGETGDRPALRTATTPPPSSMISAQPARGNCRR